MSLSSNQKKNAAGWQNRIVGYAEKPAKDFKFNPLNWRLHSEQQKNAITAILAEIGWVTGVIENATTGNLIDGHARVAEALRKDPETPVPYLQIKLSLEEEKKILALLDPLGDLASTDEDRLQQILDEIKFEDDRLAEIVAGLLIEDLPEVEKEITPNLDAGSFDYENKFGVIVECDSEIHQKAVFDRLSGEGLKVKVVVV